jgi:NAD-dependent deacetylase
MVWRWYDWRRALIAGCRPNPAHDVLARWSRRSGVTLITQNVDGLHELAGAERVVRFHGSIWELCCANACAASPDSWEDRTVPIDPLPPRCGWCGELARPAVVWFGERIDSRVLDRCLQATTCDVFLSVGTSALVYPAASLVHAARAQGAFTAEINPAVTDRAAFVDLAIPMTAEDALPLLDR